MISKYDNTNKPRDGNDLATLVLLIHNQKHPDNPVLKVSHSTLSRIKKQYNMNIQSTIKRKFSMMTVDDSVLIKFESTLNNIFIDYTVHNLILKSDTTRIQQSSHIQMNMCTYSAEGNILPIYYTMPNTLYKIHACTTASDGYNHVM